MDIEPRPNQPQNPPAPVEPAAVASPPAAADTTPPTPFQPTVSAIPPKKSKKFVLILILLIVLLGGGFAVYKLLSKPATKSAATKTVTKKDIPSIVYEAFSGGFNQTYPDVDAPGDVVSLEYNSQIFEGLVGREGLTKITPVLASGWSNPDDTTWVFKLKDNVKYHDGNIMTADDVKYSLETVKKKEAYDIYTSTIKNVVVVNSKEVKITTTAPDPLFLNKLTFLYIVDSRQTTKPSADRASGAYNIKPGTKPTEDKVELVAFDDFHGGHVYTRALSFVFNSKTEDPDEAEVMAVDSVSKHTTNITGFLGAKQVNKANQLNLYSFANDDLSVRFIGFNVLNTKSPVSKLKVRQAMYLASDPNAIIKVLGEQDADKPADQILTQLVPGYNPDIKRPARNIVEAKKLLKEAGYPNGVTITLTLGIPVKNIGDELVRQLKEAGITLKLDVRDDAQKFFSDINEGKVESWYVGDSSELQDGNFLYQRLFESAYYNNPKITAQINEASKTLEDAKRLTLVQATSKALMDDVAVLPIYTRKSVWVMDKPYKLTADFPDTDIGVLFWKVYLN